MSLHGLTPQSAFGAADSRTLLPDATHASESFLGYPAAIEGLKNYVRAEVLELPKSLLEQQEDPRVLVWAARAWLIESAVRRVHITKVSDVNVGYRQWSAATLEIFLNAVGFESCPSDGADQQIYRYDEIAYSARLTTRNLPPASIDSLIVAEEHALCKGSGGIGSYVLGLQKLLGIERLGFAYLGEAHTMPKNPDQTQGWLCPKDFFAASYLNSLPMPDRALELCEIAILLYPHLRSIEVQDYKAHGLRLTQAERAGMLPPSVRIRIRCHGSHLYLERAFQQWMGVPELEVIYQEKAALETASEVVFPSPFLKELYDSLGYEIDPSKLVYQRYPYSLPEPPVRPIYSAIDTLIFYGKRTPMKGFPLFVEAIEKLIEQESVGAIRRVVVIGPTSPAYAAWDQRLRTFKSAGLTIEEHTQSKLSDVLQTFRTEAGRALVLMPYPSDNMPVAVLDAVAHGCRTLCAEAGGIPYMVPPALHSAVLHPPTGQGLAGKITEYLARPLAEQINVAHDHTAWVEQNFRDPPPQRQIGSMNAMVADPVSRKITVIVPCFNTPLEYVSDLIAGLNCQSLAPNEVVFVDDGSATGYAESLEELIASTLRVPYRLLRHSVNRGLAGARNTALATIDAGYVINIDSDDIPRLHFVRSYTEYLDCNPDCAAVTSYNDAFMDGRDFSLSSSLSNCFRPVGDGIIYGQFTNCFGHANSAFRVHVLKSLGGWDESSKAMWEDWALYIKMRSESIRIGVIPRAHFLYRYRPSSMSRTYNFFEAQLRLAQYNLKLSRFETLRLKQIVHNFQVVELEHKKLPYRIVNRGLRWVYTKPGLVKVLKKLRLLSSAFRASLGRLKRSLRA